MSILAMKNSVAAIYLSKVLRQYLWLSFPRVVAAAALEVCIIMLVCVFLRGELLAAVNMRI